MYGQQFLKQSSSMASRMRSTEDRYIDYSSHQPSTNQRHHLGGYLDKEGPMFTSKYIVNPFKDTQQELQFHLPHDDRAAERAAADLKSRLQTGVASLAPTAAQIVPHGPRQAGQPPKTARRLAARQHRGLPLGLAGGQQPAVPHSKA
jgi:hypothetical protein